MTHPRPELADASPADAVRVARVEADDARRVVFTSTLKRWKNGYDEDEVDAFLDRVIATLDAYEQAGADPEPDTPDWHERRAVELLSGTPTVTAASRAHAHAALAQSLRLRDETAAITRG